MNSIRPFQIVLLAGFGFLAIVALIFLSAYQAQRQEKAQVYGDSVEIWGTLPQAAFKATFKEIGEIDRAFRVVTYKQMNEETFDEDLINAIAEGRSPDLILLPSSALVAHRAKLIAIPYKTFSERTFRDTYVDGAEVFALDEGIYGFPLAIDPMIMFWNRDMFASNGLAQAPKSWEEIVSNVVPVLTTRDTTRNVLQSGVSFGEYRNVAHAKNILLLLLLQSGSKMSVPNGNEYEVSLNQSIDGDGRAPFEAAVQFYTDFSNVNSPLYSWNRAMPTDTNAFLAGDLGLYFGLGSEYYDIADKNPNLNFDIAMVPQGAQATALRTYGEIYAFAIPRASKNTSGAYAVVRVLSDAQYASQITKELAMAPARRDVIKAGDEDVFRKIILQSALITRTWLDPSTKESDAIFMEMIEDIVSNRARIGEAVGDAVDRLILIY